MPDTEDKQLWHLLWQPLPNPADDYWREATETAQSEAANPDNEPPEDLG